MANQIKWEPYHDPLTGSKNVNPFDDDDDEGGTALATGRIIMGPMGFIKLDDKSLFSSKNELWVGHTNFYLTGPIAKRLEFTKGVETLKVVSPYRFLIGFGHSFEAKEVKERIEKKFCKTGKENKVANRINIMGDYLHKLGQPWAVFITENGTLDYVTGTQEQVLKVIADKKKGAKEVFTWLSR